MTYHSPAALRAALRKYGLFPKKGLGQHFLWRADVVERIAEAAALTARDVVVEIGAGLGILTVACARRAGLVIALEVDARLFPPLEEAVAGHHNVRLVQEDARTADFEALVSRFAPGCKEFKVVGNLPYYLATTLIMRLLEEAAPGAGLFVFMVQEEVAARFVARPGGKEYGALSVAVQYRGTPEVLFRVSPQAFFPPPEVSSAVVRIRRHTSPPVEVADEGLFFRVVRAAFGYRRKTLRNSLLAAGLLVPGREEEVFRRAGIAPERRGETLDLAEFARLAAALGAQR